MSRNVPIGPAPTDAQWVSFSCPSIVAKSDRTELHLNPAILNFCRHKWLPKD